MLTNRDATFHETVVRVAAAVGMKTPEITDRVIKVLFPNTMREAVNEGSDRMFRAGVLANVKAVIRKTWPQEDAQIDMAEKYPGLMPIVEKLGSKTYYVEALDEQVPVPRLIEEPPLLDDARKYMRRKGNECLAEADRLDELYAAVTAN